MNKNIKITLAILGAVNVVFNLVTPYLLSLLIVKFYTLTGLSMAIVMITGFLSSLYRAIDVADIETFEYFYQKYNKKWKKKKHQ